MQTKSLAIWTALLALGLFFVSISLPCVEITDFGQVQSLSLLGGIKVLWSEGHFVLGSLIFMFTIVFPPTKLIATLLIAAPPSVLVERHKMGIYHFISHLGKWSLLDVLVIAILVVAIKVHGLVSVQMTTGTYFFTATIFLSMVAGHLSHPNLRINKLPSLPKVETGLATAQRVFAKWRHNRWLIVATFLVATGIFMLMVAPGKHVEAICVTKRNGLISFSNLFGDPSYYLVVRTLEGPMRLKTKPSTPIGNGLTWQLNRPVSKSDIYEIDLFDSGWFSDKLVDRVDLSEGNTIGQHFQFELRCRRPKGLIPGLIILVAGLTCGVIVTKRSLSH